MTRRDRLMNRPLPHVVVPIQVEDPQEATEALSQAHTVLRQALLKSKAGTGQKVAKAQAAVAKAQAAVDACWERITVTALKPKDYQRLIAAHQPTPEQAAEDEIWNPDTFKPALVHACTEGDMTVNDWAEFLTEHAATGEGRELVLAAMAVNERARQPDVVLPKDLTQIRSLLSNLT